MKLLEKKVTDYRNGHAKKEARARYAYVETKP